MADVYDKSKPSDLGIVTDELSDLRNNWDAVETRLNKDHRFNDGAAIDGYHKAINMAVEGADPALAVQGVLYTKSDGTNNELFYRNANAIVQITKDVISGSNGEAFLPGGIGIKWGTISKADYTAATATFTYAGAGPGGLGLTSFTTATYSLVVSMTNGAANSSVRVATFDKDGFQLSVDNPGNMTFVYWIAIGS